jgi:hypothetical protein
MATNKLSRGSAGGGHGSRVVIKNLSATDNREKAFASVALAKLVRRWETTLQPAAKCFARQSNQYAVARCLPVETFLSATK